MRYGMLQAFRHVGFWSLLFLAVKFFHFQSWEDHDGWGSGYRGWNLRFVQSILQGVHWPLSGPWYAFYLGLDFLAGEDPL